MDYAAHYARLIERARCRASTRKQAQELVGYVERHRIVPGCMGGNYAASNVAYLTGEEHYVAHQLLVKMYPEVNGLVCAAIKMAHQCVGSRAYGWLRRRKSEAMKGKTLGRSPRGIPKPPGHGDKIRAAQAGVKRRPLSPEHRAKLSALRKGRPKSEQHKQNIRAALLGNTNGLGKVYPPRSAEHSAKLAAAIRGKRLPPRAQQHCSKISLALLARAGASRADQGV